jgi:hypothetical protein
MLRHCSRVSSVALFLASAFLMCATLASAQTNPPQRKPASSPAAEIILPALLAVDKPGTLAVLDAQGQLVSGVSVDLSTGRRVTTDETGRARFVVTSEPGPFLASITGTEVRASSVVVAQTDLPASQILIVACPRAVTRSDHFTVNGSNFRGDADDNHVTLGGQPALVIASSPLSLELWLSPQTPLGSGSLRIEISKGGGVATSVDVVSLRIERREHGAAAVALRPGKTQQLVVHVEGTQNQTPIVLLNLSPGVVELVGGAFQRIVSRGGANNEAAVEIHGIHDGEISISARLAVRGSTTRDPAAARRALEAARDSAKGDWAARVDGALERLNGDPTRVEDVLQDVERMLDEDPPPIVGRHLEAVWIALAS